MTYKLTPRADRIRLLEQQIHRLVTERNVLIEAETANIPTPVHPWCGTNKGYRRHKHYGEAACEPCKDAHAANERSEYARKKLLRQQAATVDNGVANRLTTWENVSGPEGASTPESPALTAPLNASEQRG